LEDSRFSAQFMVKNVVCFSPFCEFEVKNSKGSSKEVKKI
jgi:hypothetical protein